MNKMVHENHITKTWIMGKTKYFITNTTECPVCSLEREIEDRKQESIEKLMVNQSEELACDSCGTIIGFVYEGDLNGSRFYCNSCKENEEV